jgi:hypothetical protein
MLHSFSNEISWKFQEILSEGTRIFTRILGGKCTFQSHSDETYTTSITHRRLSLDNLIIERRSLTNTQEQ